MSQNFLFSSLPQFKTDRQADLDILKKAQTTNKTRTVRAAASGGTKWANKVAIAVDAARRLLVDDGSIICIQDEKTFFDYIEKIKKNKCGSIDTETTGLDPIIDRIVGLCMYTPGEQSAYVPLWHTDFDDNPLPNQLSHEIVLAGLEEIKHIPMDYHNAIFDWRIIRNSMFGIQMKIGWCTQLASNYLNELEIHKLKVLYDKYVSKTDDKSATFSELFNKIPFNYVPIDVAYLYGGKDPKMTYELAEFQRQYLLPDSKKAIEKGLSEAGRFLTQTEIPLIPIVGRMEDKGIEISEDKSKELDEKYTKAYNEAEAHVHKIISLYDVDKLPIQLREKLSNPVNLNSPQQLSIILYDLLKLKSPDKKAPRGTGEKILEELAESESEYKEFFDGILEYRGIAKLLSTYIQKLPAIVKAKTGRLHARFNQYGARTGRFSSEGPNLQNIPSKNKDIRKMFKAAFKHVLISTDFSQQEPRVLAHLCYVLFNDRSMIDAYESGKDLYSWMASMVYGIAYEECKEFYPDGKRNPEGYKRRDSVKSILLGLMYGRRVKSIAGQLGTTEKEAQKIVDMLFNTFPAIKQVVDYYISMAKKYGYVTTVYGRKCRIPDMQLPKYQFVYADDREREIEDEGIIDHYWSRLDNCKSWYKKQEIYQEANEKNIWILDNTFKISEAERQCLNSVIQGTSADITKVAMKLVGEDEQLKEWGLEMLIPIHDEILSECPEEIALKAAERVCQLMIASCADKIIVPMKCEPEITRIWYGDDVTEELKEKYAA